MTVALITGVSRQEGLGFEIARQLGEPGIELIITARRESQLTPLVSLLQSKSYHADGITMDLDDEETIKEAAKIVRLKHGKLDILVNNAALMGDMSTVANKNLDYLRAEFNTNVVGTWAVTQAFYPLLKQSEHGRVVNVTSGSGSFEDPLYGLLNKNRGFDISGYAITKAAINAMTIKMADEFAADGIKVNAVCPGITDTRGMNRGRDVAESACGIVWAATLDDNGPTVTYSRDGQILP